jgi:HK97 family phage portal protein
MPTPWNGWPSEWGTDWNSTGTGLNKLIDTAWACIDLNSNVLSTMPVYLLRGGEVSRPKQWMINPDDTIYTGWPEFAKQMFWDYMLGEVFILSLEEGGDNRPRRMRVIPPWAVNVEMVGGRRVYSLGREDVTSRMLHIRYQSTTADAHGHGPLEVANARCVTAGVLQRYAMKLAETGGVPHYWIGVDKYMNQSEADELLDIWVASRQRRLGDPALLTSGSALHSLQSMSAKDMALLELAQFSESRIAVLLGVPPFLVGLPGPGGLTYANEAQLFDFHDRSSLGPKAVHVMTALSNWSTTRPQTLELNRDEYSRPNFAERTDAEVKLVEAGAMSIDELRIRERFNGPAPGALVGNDQATTSQDTTDQAAVGRNGYAVQGK